MAPDAAQVLEDALRLPPDQRAARLHAALRQSEAEFAAGPGIPASAVLRVVG